MLKLMKFASLFTLLVLIAAILLPSGGHAQTLTTEKMLTNILGSNTSSGFPPQATAANALVNSNRGVVLNANSGSAVITTPSGASITFSDKAGTVATSQASTAVALTADNQVVTPGVAARIQLSSDNTTATNRTFTLSATGAVTGQIYVLIAPVATGSFLCEMADTGIQVLSAAWSPNASDTLTLMFDGTNFMELARSAN
jgi:hypothetical protein